MSQAKPAYITTKTTINEVELPQMSQQKEVATTANKEVSEKPKNQKINTTELRTEVIEREDFEVVTDSFNKNITDMELLCKLKDERWKIAQEEKLPQYIGEFYFLPNFNFLLIIVHFFFCKIGL